MYAVLSVLCNWVRMVPLVGLDGDQEELVGRHA